MGVNFNPLATSGIDATVLGRPAAASAFHTAPANLTTSYRGRLNLGTCYNFLRGRESIST